MDVLSKLTGKDIDKFFNMQGLLSAFKIVAAVTTILQSLYIKVLYHTSVFTGKAWVSELLYGHLKWIWTELGVTIEVFHALVLELQNIGHQN